MARSGVERRLRRLVSALAVVLLAGAGVTATTLGQTDAANAAVTLTPDATHAVVVAHTVSDRVSTTGTQLNATPLAGVQLVLAQRTGGAGSAASPYSYTPLNLTSYPWASCTSDADGDCAIRIPIGTAAGSFAQDSALYLVQTASTAIPAGYNRDLQIGTGTATPVNVSVKNYAIRVGASPSSPNNTAAAWRLRPATGATAATDGYYYAGLDFQNSDTGSTGASTNQYLSSTGLWPISRDDPPPSTVCGLRIALVLDVSASTAGAGLVGLKTAANALVDALAGTPSSVAVFPFATTDADNMTTGGNRGALPLTSVAVPGDPNGAVRVHNKINALQTESGGYTNWGMGLSQILGSDGTASQYDLVVMVTDGNPTVYGSGIGAGGTVTTMARDVGAGVFAANTIKRTTRLIAIGVGDGINSAGSASNLQAITAPNPPASAGYQNYYQEPSYTAAADVLNTVATQNCAGTVTVVKSVVPPGTSDHSFAGLVAVGVPAGGWTISGATSTSGIDVAPASAVTDASGSAQFKLDFHDIAEDASFSINETQQAGYALVPVTQADPANSGADRNAYCVGRTAGDPGSDYVPQTLTDAGADGATMAAPPPFMIACYLFNSAPPDEATARVDKSWVVDGEALQLNTEPTFASGAPSIDGASGQEFGTSYAGYVDGDTVSLTESTALANAGCTLASAELTQIDGDALATPVDVSGGAGYDWALHGGSNAALIVNTISCTQSLYLFKAVNGSLDPANWELSASPVGAGDPGPSGTSGANAAVSEGVEYSLREDPAAGADPGVVNYEQYDNPSDPSLRPAGSNGSWVCRVMDGTVFPDSGDSVGGDNGGVTLGLGQSIGCETSNSTAELTLVKNVVNNGGSAQASDWNLVATPQAPEGGALPPGVAAQTVPGSTAGTTIEIYPGLEYELTEQGGPPGYTLADTACSIDLQRAAIGSAVTVPAGSSATCTLTNEQGTADLAIQKSHTGGAVASGEGDTVPFTLQITNLGAAAAYRVAVTDDLPAGLTIQPGSLSGADWDFTGSTDTVVFAQYVGTGGVFAPGYVSTIAYTAVVGELTKAPDGSYPDLVNTAIVGSETPDDDPSNNTDTDAVPVRSISLSAQAICATDVLFTVTPRNVGAAPTVAVIWWQQDRYAARDASIPASDEAAILADGADHVDYLTPPSGWTDGESFTRSVAWPSEASLGATAVIEVRADSSASVTVTRPATLCGGGSSEVVPNLGTDVRPGLSLGLLLLAAGLLALAVRGGLRRRRP